MKPLGPSAQPGRMGSMCFLGTGICRGKGQLAAPAVWRLVRGFWQLGRAMRKMWQWPAVDECMGVAKDMWRK